MRVVWIILGVIGVALGALWTLQGLNVIKGSSAMSGNSTWAIIGPIVLVVGLLLFLVGVRRRSRVE
jgi:cytochrome bd-type quinol oxidase subunit 2